MSQIFVALDTFLDETVLARAERVVEVLRQYHEDGEFSGKSASHSVVEAAARSYLQAANKAAYEMKRLEDTTPVGSGSVHKNAAVDRLFPGGY